MKLAEKAAGAGAVRLMAASFAIAVGCLTLACTEPMPPGPVIDASADDADAGADAAPDSGHDAGTACEWDLPDGGHIVCPVDAPQSCPAPDGCNQCVCHPDKTRACSSHPC